LHQQHIEQQAAIHDRLHEIHQRVVAAVADQDNGVAPRPDQANSDAQ
jgi:hypothetical protein